MQTIDKRKITPTQSLVRSALWLGLTLIVFIGLIKLSFWQYNRGIEKEQRLTRITELNQQSPLTLEEIITISAENSLVGKEGINDFPITINGKFDGEHVFLLDNQVEKRSLGYRVFQIVHTPKYAVLVNLGWVQGSIDRSKIPEVTPLHGQYKFEGHVRIIEQGIMLTSQDFSQPSWPLRVQQIELAKFSTLVDKPLLPFVVYLNQDEVIGFKKNWHPIVMPPEKHFAYSFQWASLAIAWLILMICLRVKTQQDAKKSSPKTKNNKQSNIQNKIKNNNNKTEAIKHG